jgi:hypothetical protein
LHHLGEIAGRVVRRQQAELRTARRRDALDTACDHGPRKGVDGYLRFLAEPDTGQLRLLVVGDHPDVLQRDDGNDLRAGMDILPGPDAVFADHAVDRRDDPGVTEIDLRQIERRPLGLGLGPELRFLRIQHRHLAPLGVEFGLIARERRFEAPLIGDCLLDLLRRAEAGRQQRPLSCRLPLRALDIGFGRRDGTLRLCDLSVLEVLA